MYVTANRSKKISSAENIQYFSQNLQWCIFISQAPCLLPVAAIWLPSPSCFLSRAKGTNRSAARSKSVAHFLNVWRIDSDDERGLQYRRGWTLVFTQQKAFSYRREWMGILGCEIPCLNTEVGSLHQTGLGASLSGRFLPSRLKTSAAVLKETAGIREWANENKEGKKKEKRESCTSFSI